MFVYYIQLFSCLQLLFLIGVSRSVCDTPPTHYTVKIQSFSQLTKNKIENYTSTAFEAGGYNW